MNKQWILPAAVMLLMGALSNAHAEVLLKAEREAWAEKGVTMDVGLIEDFVSVVKGGVSSRTTWLGRFDLVVDLDTEKMGYWKGGNIHIDLMNAHGHKKPSADLITDAQVINNIEAPRSTRLLEAWIEQSFMDGKLAALAGLHDMNADFAVSENGGLYLNSAMGITTSITSNTGSSVYALTAPGARLKYTPNEQFALLLGIYDGDPGDADENITNIKDVKVVAKQTLEIVEGQVNYNLPMYGGLAGTFKVGGWYNSSDTTDQLAVDENSDPVPHDDNYGGYAIVDQLLFKEAENQGLSVFFVGGGAPKNRNTFQSNIVAGLNYTGLFPSRDEDVLGVAFTSSFYSDRLRESGGQDKAETTYELTYQMKINDNLTVQPDFQYVKNPNGKDVKNASVIMLRSELHF